MMLKGFWGEEPLVELKEATVQKTLAEVDSFEEGDMTASERAMQKAKEGEEPRASEESWEQETEDQKKIDQWMIDNVVEELEKMELSQREKEGDDEGFEHMSDHWLKFTIWKVEQEWAGEKFNEAQKSHGMSGADASRPREEADKADRVEERQKTTKHNKQTENSQEEEDEQYEPEKEASCDLETGEKKTQDHLIPMPATGGA